jgi:signal transduction histidine kinase
MSAYQLLQLISQALFVLIFLATAARAARWRTRANLDTSLLFGVTALLVAETWISGALGVTKQPAWLSAAAGAALMSLSYLLLRLADDFTGVPSWMLPTATAGLAAIVVGIFVLPQPYPGPFVLVCVLYFIALAVYAANAFVQAARGSSGVTGRRMVSVAAGSLCIGVVIVVAGLQAAIPAAAGLWTVLSALLGLASGLAFYVGFMPPRWLRRTWQEPEVRAFLSRAAELPRLPTTSSIVEALEQGAAASLGVPWAVIGLWDESAQVLRYKGPEAEVVMGPDELIAGRAFAGQRPVFSADALRDDPEHADRYLRGSARAIMAAPITAGTVRLGVLAVYASRPPIFAEDDLLLVRLLADQAAVILESRALIDQAARVQAREVATRLKDDFLSSAAHDLKTPLTALVGQAQLMERRAERNPSAPVDLHAVHMIAKGRLVGTRERTDLTALAQDACARHSSERNRCVLEAAGQVYAEVDPIRAMQLVDNLLENAVQYSPNGADVRVSLRAEGDSVFLAVADEGIGIPPDDLHRLFDRFHRGLNVDDRRFAGLGLGLYICRGIVQEHGGRIWATSPGIGRGSAFHVTLPVAAAHTPAKAGAEPALADAGERR